MKTCTAFSALSLCVCLFATGQTVPTEAVPTETGTYLQAPTHWDKLYVASMSGIRTSGAAKTMFTYGVASMKSVLVFRDATAPVKTFSVRPVFRIIGNTTTAPRDTVIVQLQQKKDHRELQVGKVNAYNGMKYEYPAEDVTKVDVTDTDKYRTVVPQVSLKPGEYILFTGSPSPMPSGYGGYDFSVASAK
jgi:hypothetical protein